MLVSPCLLLWPCSERGAGAQNDWARGAHADGLSYWCARQEELCRARRDSLLLRGRRDCRWLALADLLEPPGRWRWRWRWQRVERERRGGRWLAGRRCARCGDHLSPLLLPSPSSSPSLTGCFDCPTAGCSTLADVDVDPDELSGAQLLALNACAQEFGMQDDDFVMCVIQFRRLCVLPRLIAVLIVAPAACSNLKRDKDERERIRQRKEFESQKNLIQVIIVLSSYTMSWSAIYEYLYCILITQLIVQYIDIQTGSLGTTQV